MRIELNLKKSDRNMSGWEISKFLNKLNDKYYKVDLLNTLAPFLEENSDKIFIMNSSFSLENNYRYMKGEDLYLLSPNNIERWYYLGIPIPFDKKNIFLVKLSFYFNLIRNLNSKFLEYGLGKLNKNLISEIYTILCENDNNLNNKKLNESLIEKINISCQEKYDLFEIETKKDQEKFFNLKSSINKIISESNSNNFLSKDFFETFVSLDRPIVGIYNHNQKTIKILCDYSISPLSSSNEKLDIKKIEHNSPTLMQLFMGGTSILILIPLFKALLIKLQNQRASTEEVDQIKTQISNELTKLEDIVEENNLNKIDAINDPFLKDFLMTLQEKNTDDILTLLKDNKMLNKDLSTVTTR